jgi:hypothetical protein
MTTTVADAPRPPGRSLITNIILAGLAGGAVDGVYASCVGLIHGRTVVKVWQGVAGGWLGKDAGQGGLATAALGLATHFGIAICMAAAFALVASRVRLLYQRPLIAGAAYGLVLYTVMYRIVLPLRWPAIFPKWDGVQSITDIASHVGVGLAIAWVLSRAARASLSR